MDRDRRDEYVSAVRALDALLTLPVWPTDSGDPHGRARTAQHAVDVLAWFDPDEDVRQAAAQILSLVDHLAATIDALREGAPGHNNTLTLADRETYDAAVDPVVTARRDLLRRAQCALGVR